MSSGRVLCSFWCAALACGEEREREEPKLALGDFSFTASPFEVVPCGSTSLEWNAPGAKVVNIESDGVTLIATFDQNGTLESPPICDSTTFALTARGDDASRMETLTVRVRWPEPEILSFTTFPEVIIGDETDVDWSVENASSFSLTQNGELILEHVLTLEQVLGRDDPPSNFEAEIDTATTSFVLTASNSAGAISKELIVRALPLSIESFVVHPPARIEPGPITISWETVGTRTELFFQGGTVVGFSGEVSGTFSMDVDPQGVVELHAVRPDPNRSRPARKVVMVSLDLPTVELEPNDDFEHRTPRFAGGSIGAISPAGDVDFLTNVDRGRPIRIWIEPLGSGDCTIHPTLALYDVDGVELGRVDEPPSEEDRVCALIEEARHPFLSEVSQEFVVAVIGTPGETGDYLLLVQDDLARAAR